MPASYLCIPLVALGDTLGVLHIQYNLSEGNRGTEAFESLQESQQRLAVAAGGRVAFSLASLLLRETLRAQSIRDPLTGLFHRRFVEHALDRELQRAKRRSHSLVVVFLDLDHFKRFNGTHGHDAGDAVLRSMAALFQKHFRGEDIVCRFGGEEFAFILPESSSKDAAKRVEDLRQAAKNHRITHKEQVLDIVTFSVGIAAYPENGLVTEELLQTAVRIEGKRAELCDGCHFSSIMNFLAGLTLGLSAATDPSSIPTALPILPIEKKRSSTTERRRVPRV